MRISDKRLRAFATHDLAHSRTDVQLMARELLALRELRAAMRPLDCDEWVVPPEALAAVDALGPVEES